MFLVTTGEGLMPQLQSPILTIATVTRNCVGTLAATLKSVREIANASIQYVVVDGASTDGTLELLQQYRELIDDMVSEPDRGIYNAMNKAVRLARGEYILFLNGDDVLLPAGQIAVMEELAKRRAAIVCATTLVGSASHPDETLVPQPWRLPFYNSIPHPSAFASTSLLKQYPFREDLRIASDYDFFLGCFLRRVKFKVLPVDCAVHQRGGASGNVELSLREVEQIQRYRLNLAYPLIAASLKANRLIRHRVVM